MTVADILEQAKTLSVDERKQLAKLLIDSLGSAPDVVPPPDAAHWGQQLLQVLQQTPAAAWGEPEIADPVAALEAVRRQEQSRLDDTWNAGQ